MMMCIFYLGLSIHLHKITLAADRTWVQSEKHLKIPFKWNVRCSWRLWSRDFGEVNGCRLGSGELKGWLGDRDWVIPEIYLDAEIKWLWRCTCIPWSGKPEGCDYATMKILLEAIIRQTWRLWSCEIGDAIAAYNRASLEMFLEAMIQPNYARTWRQSNWRHSRLRQSIRNLLIWGRSIGINYCSWDSIYCLTYDCGNAEKRVPNCLPIYNRWETG